MSPKEGEPEYIRERVEGEEGKEDDQSGLPPFVSTWGGFYRLVLFTFLGMVLLFYAIQVALR